MKIIKVVATYLLSILAFILYSDLPFIITAIIGAPLLTIAIFGLIQEIK